MKTILRTASRLSIAIAFCGICCTTAFAASRTTLYAFGPHDGSPVPLTMDANGVLYGGISIDGPAFCTPSDCGAIFRLTPPAPGDTVWSEDTLHGRAPNSGVYLGNDGSLFGLVGNTISQLTPQATSPWPITPLQTVANQTVGAGNLISDGQGGFFGLTNQDGTNHFGTLYQFSPSNAGWSLQTLFNFPTPSTGNFTPPTGLVRDAQGALYGFYLSGSDVFKLTPPSLSNPSWSETIIHHFMVTGLSAPLAIDKNGAIYGVTGNKIFKLSPPKPKQTKWALTTVFNFANSTKAVYGQYPSTVLVDSAGAVFGLTMQGGPNIACGSIGCGTLFQLTPIAGTTKYAIDIVDNSGGTRGLWVPLIADRNGTLYGMTGTNEFTASNGIATRPATVFQVTGSGFQP